MKRIRIPAMLGLVLILALFAASAALAEDTFTCGDYMYVLREDGSAEVVGYTGENGDIVIPNELDGHPIMAMRYNVFSVRSGDTAYTVSVYQDHPYLATINGVLFGKSDRKLICYPYALARTEYAIPQGIEVIGEFAFYDCSSLTAVTIPDSVTSIGDNAFYGCRGLTAVTIPDGVTSIGEFVFNDCSGLTVVTIPDSVTSIGEGAFAFCRGLTAVTIPDSVTSIGDGAFSGCSGLTAVTIPDSVTSIGAWAFDGCNSLTINVRAGSFAETYCKGNRIPYTTYDPALEDAPTDWLTGG